MQACKPVDLANIFNAFFHSVFGPPDEGIAADCLPMLDYTVVNEVNVLHLEVDKVCKHLKSIDINN